MTLPAIPDQGGALASWEGDTGLEDFDARDASIPRLTIDHLEAVFKDSQTDRKYPALHVKMLGLVKQRLMWRPEPKDGNEVTPPLCKSTDFRHGFPNMDEKAAADDKFPWPASNYTPADMKPVEGTNLLALGCDNCAFKEWGSNPKSNAPWCSEEWVIPLMYFDGEDWCPAIFSVKRSGLKATKRYFTAFQTKRLPLFTKVTILSLEKQRRGNVQYCTPIYTAGDPTDPGEWQTMADDFKGIKAFITQPPQDRDSDDTGPARVSGNDNVIDAETVPGGDPWGSQPTSGNDWPSEPAPSSPVPPPSKPQAPAPAPSPAPAAPTPPAAPAPPSAPAPAAPTPPPPAASSAPEPPPALADDDEPPF